MWFSKISFFILFFLQISNLQAAGAFGENQNNGANPFQNNQGIAVFQNGNIKQVHFSAAELQALSQNNKTFYLSLLPMQGTCTQEILRVNPNDASSGRNTQNIRTSLQDCMNRFKQDYWGQESCPERAYRYSFSFDLQNGLVLNAKSKEVLTRVDLGEKVCQYTAWLESRPDFKQAIFWEEWTPEEKRAFFNYIRNLHKGQEFGFRRPWEGPEKTRENCHDWRDPVFYPSNVLGGAARQVDSGGCKDWRGSPPNYTDAEIRLSWIGRAALSSYLTVAQRVSWGLPNTPEKMRLLFPNSIWTHRFEPEGYRLDMEFADASRVFYFYVRNGILDKNNQWNTVRNLIQLGKVGQPTTQRYKFHHGTGGCGTVPKEVVEAKTALGQPIVSADFVSRNADCDPRPFSEVPKDFDFYMLSGTDDGCNGMGRHFFHSLNFLNIPTKYDQYASIDPRTGRVSHWSHAYSIFYLDSGTYGLGHNDDIYDSHYTQMPPESILIPERYFPRLYQVYDTNDTIEATMELPPCLAYLNHLQQRCCINPSLEPFELYGQNACRTITYNNRIYDAGGSLVSSNETTIELLNADEYNQLLQVIQSANRLCQGAAGDPQPDDRFRPGCNP